MNPSELGRLENVELREYFKSESQDFTPWLATPENIKLLGDAVGLELEVEAQEKDVGPFRADILCKDTDSNNWVIIENQLEPTDHSHLGQLLTYAAGLHAFAIIWVSEQFRPEHRAALDWLNEMTREGVAFFGVEVELLRIGNSPAAARFDVVSKPNTFSKEAQTSAEGELSEVRQTQLAFWTAFSDYLKTTNKIIRTQRPRADSWMSYSIGKGGCSLSSVASSWDSEANRAGGELRAEVVLNDSHAKSYFSLLNVEKEEIERELGEPLHWHNPAGKRMCRIYVRRSGDISDRSKWPEYHEWLKTKLEALHQVFSPRLRAMRSPESLNGDREAESEQE